MRRRGDITESNTTGFKQPAPERTAHLLIQSSLSLSALGIGASAVLTGILFVIPTSTYICPSSSSSYSKNFASATEILDVGLLLFLLHAFSDLIETCWSERSNAKERPFVEGVGYALIVSGKPTSSDHIAHWSQAASGLLFLGGLMAFITHPMNWQWVFNFDQSYIWSLCWFSLLFTGFVQASVVIVSAPSLVCGDPTHRQ